MVLLLSRCVGVSIVETCLSRHKIYEADGTQDKTPSWTLSEFRKGRSLGFLKEEDNVHKYVVSWSTTERRVAAPVAQSECIYRLF